MGLPRGSSFALYGSENLPDMDNVRVIPKQGVYTSIMFNPPESADNDIIEWGTISAGVTLPANAQADKEQVFLSSDFMEDISILPGPNDLAPGSSLAPSGGNIVLTGTYPFITYRIYMFSDYNTVLTQFSYYQASLFRKIPVVEDVTITYMPQTKIVYQGKL